MSDADPFLPMGLSPLRPEHHDLFDRAFQNCRIRLSDYSFAATYIWQDAIRLGWRLVDDCLCVFANGHGGLTLLLPPIGPGRLDVALREAAELCRAFNHRHGYPDRVTVEYVSDELLTRLPVDCTATPMSGDYLYPTSRMIDLAGGDLASKRHDRNRFARRHAVRTELFEPRHRGPCLDLLARWHHHRDDLAQAGAGAVREKRMKEEASVVRALLDAQVLGLEGLVLYADDRLVGFTFGERLTDDTFSVLIEKTDLDTTGSAQYIFSEFCRQCGGGAEWINAGDDWDVPGLARTKQSYRPAARLGKWSVELFNHAWIGVPEMPRQSERSDHPVPDRASVGDLDRLMEIEAGAFSPDVAFSRRQLRHLLGSPRVDVHVLKVDGTIVADAVVLRHRSRMGDIGRLYSMAVDADFRGRGLGRKLLETCLASLRDAGVPRVYLEVDQSNEPAIRLYESAGFVVVRELPYYYGPDHDGWKMRLDLTRHDLETHPVGDGVVEHR